MLAGSKRLLDVENEPDKGAMQFDMVRSIRDSRVTRGGRCPTKERANKLNQGNAKE